MEGKANNKTQARKPARFDEFKVFGRKTIGMKYSFLFLLVSFGVIHSQNSVTNQLDEIVLLGNFSPVINSGYQVEVLGDSLLGNQYGSLGTLLQKEANFYFKQNGRGMVSSISLRGTGASQTGVYWNGIAVNSSLNGQTDFNTLQVNGFDEVEIRKGGASVLLGSGAIGGAVNLRDNVQFGDRRYVQILFGAGSYQTFEAQAKALWSNKDFYGKIAVGGQRSENDYPYPGTDLINENGAFGNYSLNAVLGYRFNDLHSLSLKTSYFNNDRDLSRTLTSESNSNLKNEEGRFLLGWTYLGNRVTSSLNLAVLTEDFRYYQDKDIVENESNGNGQRVIGKYDLSYFVNNRMFFKSGVEWQHAVGEGSSISSVSQDDLSGYVLMHHQPMERWMYNISVRAGGSSAYTIPFIYSVDVKYAILKHLALRTGISSNYRLPTFNDLYWEPGGNPDLKPESSNSGEIGFDYTKGRLSIRATAYLIKSEDLIQWRPLTQDFWIPENVSEATNTGLELSGRLSHEIGDHHLTYNLTYDYTRARDDQLDKQLIYVPEHKASGIVDYRWNKWVFNYNLSFVGSVYTTTSNSQQLDPYWLSDVAVYRSILKDAMGIRLMVNNLFDKNYESVAYRPMPNRNYFIQINIKL